MRQDYGSRPDGSKKGRGFFGPIRVPGTGSVATEATFSFDADGREVSAPLLSSNLDARERAMVLDALSRDEFPSDEIVGKSSRHALARMMLGLSTYREDADDRFDWRTMIAKGVR